MSIKLFRAIQIVFAVLCSLYFGYFQITDSDVARANKLTTDYATIATNENRTNTANSIDYGRARAKIALDEYNKNVVETYKGCNCGPEIDKYTENGPSQWCTMFASWVTKEAGSPVKDRVSDSWKIANSRIFESYLEDHGTFYQKDAVIKDNIKPRVGDYIITFRGAPDSNLGHIYIVVAVDPSSNNVDVVSGNYRDNIAYQRNLPYLNYYGFIGFGRPEK